MNRLLRLAILSIAVIAPAYSNARVQGWCEQGNQTIQVLGDTSSTATLVQASYPSCTVTVYITGSSPLTLAAIYSDNNGTPLSNPFTASSTGLYFFYAD